MTARIRVKADRIISELTKFEVSSKTAMRLELDRNSLVTENRTLGDIEFNLKHPRDPSLMWFSSRWEIPQYSTRTNIQSRLRVLSDMSSLAQKSDDGWVEIDQGQTDFLDEIDLKLIEQSYRSDISNLKKENKKLKASIEELKKPKPEKSSEEKAEEAQEIVTEYNKAVEELRGPAPWPEPTTMDMSGFYIPCILAVLTIGLLAVIFGG